MGIIRFIFLSAATMIVLLHSMIPHGHHSDLSPTQHVEQHQRADNLFDFILLGFHVDHSDGHLEDMTSADSLDFDQDEIISCIAIVATHFRFVGFDPHQEFVVEKNWILPDSNQSSPALLRGPPTQA